MAEIALVASVIAVIQITDRIMGQCLDYVESTRDASSDLKIILSEAGSLNVIFEDLKRLLERNNGSANVLSTLSKADGPVDRCHRSISERIRGALNSRVCHCYRC